MIVLLLTQFVGIAQSPCENGYAGIYPCENINLIAHVPQTALLGATTNEVWGWTDPEFGTEYVILGASSGVFFFDISTPSDPVMIGQLPTHTVNSTWRTFRTFQNFLFVGSEAPDHGMQVFDLTRLRNVANPPETFTEDAHYAGFGNCHTLAICEETGFAYACGTNTYSGSLHIVNIQNPLEPILAGGYDLNGYTHESFVMVYDGPDNDYVGKTIAFCFNGNVNAPVTVVDVTDPTDANTISISTYPNKRYCHQGWLTEDGGYMLINDELDEYYDFIDSLHTIIFDMHDLDNPHYMGYHVGGEAIDHNLYIIGNLSYQSHYTEGLSVLDVTNIADTTLRHVAFFDHYPANNNQVFQGEWMSYPYFESGIIPVSDIHNGMFLLQPDFIDIEAPEQSCSLGITYLEVELMDGFVGPYTVSISGLPEDATYVEMLDSFAPSDGLILLDGLESVDGNLTIEVNIEGLTHNYSESVSIEIIQPQILYYDQDGDGIGISDSTMITCNSPVGFSMIAGDCAPQDPTIYPGASGSGEGVDNDCNGELESDEMASCHDLNGDGVITVIDIQILVGDLNCSTGDCIADLNDDNLVNISDLIILMADFGETCP